MNSEIEKLILDSLKELLELKCIKDPITEIKSKLVYPIKRDKTRRVSEQEIRFLFIKNIENKSDYLYSVEVPTSKEYFFTGKEENKRSGNFDVCLYGKDRERKHLIEFKSLNPKNASYNKDFVKLIKDENGLTNYFIQVLINADGNTFLNIEEKYNEAIVYAKKSELKYQSELVIFLCVIGNEKAVYRYVVKDSKLSQKNELYKPSVIPSE